VSAREKILDAAAEVIRDRGLARATTKEIARAAGYSEALLYKHFADKQAIFMGVLAERVGGLADPTELAGTGTVSDNLVDITVGLLSFYVQTFPMAASVFSTPDLLAAWRTGLTAHGGSPRHPIASVERYLESEVRLGRVAAGVDVGAVAALLCGAAFQHAFLACFEGRTAVPDAAALAGRLTRAIGF
jgi:AcrR family transcriptional regulator